MSGLKKGKIMDLKMDLRIKYLLDSGIDLMFGLHDKFEDGLYIRTTHGFKDGVKVGIFVGLKDRLDVGFKQRK